MACPTDYPCPPFFVMPLPYNERGEGPEMDVSRVVGVHYEVWDNFILSYASFDNPEMAHAYAGRLNCETEH